MKLLLVAMLVVLLSLPALAMVPETSYKTAFDFPRRYGVERVTNYDPRVNYGRIDTTVYLSPVQVNQYKGVGRGGYAPFYPRATARIYATSSYGFPLATITIMTKDLPPSYDGNIQYEVWLVDLETNYRLTLGTFTTGFGGIGSLSYRANNYIDAYDYVEITAEPFDDLDVSAGPVALVGAIKDRTPQPDYFNPPPKETRMVTTGFEKY
ncbi:MAG: hypothetical protein NTW67_03830 [Candidatus Woesearchaeota archaeon]|nr:hypothetical protein [Candidatus Woesearchaeota archaeon]